MGYGACSHCPRKSQKSQGNKSKVKKSSYSLFPMRICEHAPCPIPNAMPNTIELKKGMGYGGHVRIAQGKVKSLKVISQK
ncbi:MAG: hypothetical protein F6J93_00825 [Oscillatoria sp. SIO1A7]|nr:hypothetical protein [Oscillatoria sp. SIO1A7]